MKLYYFPIAPNPTKVRLYLGEKALAGHPISLEEVQVHLGKGEQKTPENLARNPLGRLPFLELDDGRVLLESLPIIEYLEECQPDPPLIGRDPETRAQVRGLERVIDIGVLMALGRVVHSTRSPLGWPPSPEVAANARAGVPATFDYLERLFEDGRPFVAGPEPTIADCTLAAGLQFARFGQVEEVLQLGESHPALAAWDAAYREREPARQVMVA